MRSNLSAFFVQPAPNYFGLYFFGFTKSRGRGVV